MSYVYSEKDWSWRLIEMKKVIEIDPDYFTDFEKNFIASQSITIRPSEKQALIQDRIWEKVKRR